MEEGKDFSLHILTAQAFAVPSQQPPYLQTSQRSVSTPSLAHLVLEYDTSQHRTGSVPPSREYKLKVGALNTERPLSHSAQSLHNQP